MTKLLRSAPLILIALMTLCSSGCKTKAGPAGSTKVVGPFSGSKYESNNAWFRGTGQGTSVNQSIARGKADIDAKNQLAGQVSTNMRAVTDQYLGQTENAGAADVADKFQSLVREVMNTGLADLRKIGERPMSITRRRRSPSLPRRPTDGPAATRWRGRRSSSGCS